MCKKCVTGCPYSRWTPFGNPRNFFYWLSHGTYGVLVAQLGIKLRPMAVKEWSPTLDLQGFPSGNVDHNYSEIPFSSFLLILLFCVSLLAVWSQGIAAMLSGIEFTSLNWGCSAGCSQRSLLVQRSRGGWEVGVCIDDENKIGQDLSIVEPRGSAVGAHWILLLLHMIGIFYDETFYLKGPWFFLNLLPSPIPHCECSILTLDSQSQTFSIPVSVRFWP